MISTLYLLASPLEEREDRGLDGAAEKKLLKGDLSTLLGRRAGSTRYTHAVLKARHVLAAIGGCHRRTYSLPRFEGICWLRDLLATKFASRYEMGPLRN